MKKYYPTPITITLEPWALVQLELLVGTVILLLNRNNYSAEKGKTEETEGTETT